MRLNFVMESVASGRQRGAASAEQPERTKVREDCEHCPHLDHGRAVALHPKRFAAPATITFIGINELEAFVQTFAHKIKLGTVDVRHAFRIH